jgi:hypothetical protein
VVEREQDKFYNNVAQAGTLPGRDEMQIKNKLSKLHDKYMHKKDAMNSTGAAPSSWKWLSKMEEIFGQCSNIEPEYLVHATDARLNSSGEEGEESEESQLSEQVHKSKCRRTGNRGIQALTEAITKRWESRDEITKAKLEKDDTNRREELDIKKGKLEVERMDAQTCRIEAETQKLEAENQKKMLELEILRLKASMEVLNTPLVP